MPPFQRRLLITEDVRAVWAGCLALPASPSAADWRLVNPRGVTRWVHQGDLDAGDLAAVLDDRLEASRPAAPTHIRPIATIGDRFEVGLFVGRCPAPPLHRPGSPSSKILFVDTGDASKAALSRLDTMNRKWMPSPTPPLWWMAPPPTMPVRYQAEFGRRSGCIRCNKTHSPAPRDFASSRVNTPLTAVADSSTSKPSRS